MPKNISFHRIARRVLTGSGRFLATQILLARILLAQILLAQILLAQILLAQSPAAQILVPERGLESSLQAGQAVRYSTDLERGHLLNLSVQQVGIDVTVTLLGLDGKAIFEVDGFLSAVGFERVIWIAEKPGRYQVEIRAPDGGDYPSGNIVVRLETPREAGQSGRRRAEAAETYYDALSLHRAGKRRQALKKYEEALTQWTGIFDSTWQVEIYLALGVLHFEADELQSALQGFRTALRLAGNATGVKAMAHTMAGHVFFEKLHEMEAARGHYEKALQFWQDTADDFLRGLVINNLGFTYKRLGEIQKSLDYYNDALAVWRDLGSHREDETRTLHNIGKAYVSLGRTEQARRYLGEALTQAEESGLESLVAIILTGLGQALEKEGQLEEALRNLERSLKYRGSNRIGRAVTLAEIGLVYFRMGETQRAHQLYERALAIFRQERDSRGEASVLRKLGLLFDSTDPDRARDLQVEALDLVRRAGDREGEAAALWGLARAERRRGDLAKAKALAGDVLEIVDDLRGRSDDIELRSTYLTTRQGYYDFYIDLLMELAALEPGKGHEAEALTASERSRARALLDSLYESGVEIRRGVDPTYLEEERRLERRSQALHYQLGKVLGGEGSATDSTSGIRQELQVNAGRLAVVRGEIKRASPLYAALRYPEPLGADEIQERALTEDTLLLEYQLGETRSFVWAVTTDSLHGYELPGQIEIEKLARRAYELLNVSHKGRYRAQSERTLRELADVLLGPITRLPDKKRLLIVAEGALQYIPFAALPSPADASSATPLVTRHEVVHLPSASILPVLRERLGARDAAPFGVAVMADPVFRGNDPRIRKSGIAGTNPPTSAAASGARAFSGNGAEPPERLYYTLREAEEILSLARGAKNLKAISFDADKQRVLRGDLRDFRYVHIATHGHVDGQFPELSSLVFSRFDSEGQPRDGYLRTEEIYNLELRAELVALSACRTGRGSEIRGEGLAGWTQGFLFAGAKRVLVSLWNIDDEATAALMKHFYAKLLVEELSPAAALREAQSHIRQNPSWHAPYYWAGFVLQGEFL